MPGPVRRRRGRRRHARLEPARRQLAVGPAGLRPAGRGAPRPSTRAGARRRARLPDDALADAGRAALAPFEREGGENPYTVQHDLQQTMHDLVGIIRTAPEMEQALERIEALKERVAEPVGRGPPAVQPRLAPRARPAAHAARQRVHRPGGAGAAGEPRRAHPRRLPGPRSRVGQDATSSAPRAGRRRAGQTRNRCRRCRPSSPRSSRRRRHELRRDVPGLARRRRPAATCRTSPSR